MSDSFDIFDRIQGDVTALLRAVPSLAAATVLNYDEGDIQSEVRKKLGALKDGETGKRGLVLVVMPVEAEDAETEAPGPDMGVRVDVQVIEAIKLNRGTAGTGIRAPRAAVLALNALHHQVLGHKVALWAKDKPIVPVKVPAGSICRLVTLRSRASVPASQKVSAVVAQADGSSLALTTTTAGATIYYTIDGSYPAPSNTAATEYESPLFDIAADTLVRAAAYAAGLNPSDCIELIVHGLEPATWGNIDVPWGEISTPWGELS